MSRDLKTESINDILKSVLGFMVLAQLVSIFIGFILGLEAMKICERQSICDIAGIFDIMLSSQPALLVVMGFFAFLFSFLLYKINAEVFTEIKTRCN
jgi:hypothetical protein